MLALVALLAGGCDADGVEFNIEAPERVAIAKDGGATFRITGTLSNETGKTVTLEASTPCQAEDWRILNAEGKTAARPAEKVCIQMIATRELGDGETLPLAHRIEVPPGQLEPDRDYRVLFRFWSYESSAEFVTMSDTPS